MPSVREGNPIRERSRWAIGEMSQPPCALHLLLNTAETETVASDSDGARFLFKSCWERRGDQLSSSYSGWLEAQRRINITPIQKKL